MGENIAGDIAVRFERVGKSYDGGESFAAKDVSFEVMDGETVVLLGSSGSGKSTVLKSINRLIDIDEGSIAVRGNDVRSVDSVELRRSIGYVSQSISLFPFMRVWENVSVPLRLRGISVKDRKERAAEALDLVGMSSEYMTRLPSQLSGGQQQRVGVARSLIAGCDLLLMDEPFGALDAITREVLQDELIKLKEKLPVTIVFVTHDIFEALVLADRIGVMHEGRLHQIDPPNVIRDNPGTEFVRELFERPVRQLKLLGKP